MEERDADRPYVVAVLDGEFALLAHGLPHHFQIDRAGFTRHASHVEDVVVELVSQVGGEERPDLGKCVVRGQGELIICLAA